MCAPFVLVLQAKFRASYDDRTVSWIVQLTADVRQQQLDFESVRTLDFQDLYPMSDSVLDSFANLY